MKDRRRPHGAGSEEAQPGEGRSSSGQGQRIRRGGPLGESGPARDYSVFNYARHHAGDEAMSEDEPQGESNLCPVCRGGTMPSPTKDARLCMRCGVETPNVAIRAGVVD